MTIPSPLSWGFQRGKEIPEGADGGRWTKTTKTVEYKRTDRQKVKTKKQCIKERKKMRQTQQQQDSLPATVEIQCHLKGDPKC